MSAARPGLTYRESLAYLLSLQKLGVKLGLDNIRTLLAHLGHPERAYPVLLITGSNGKGSVAAMASAALAVAGHRVATYTSPHLVRLEERIAIAGRPIAPRRLAALATEVRAATDSLLAAGRLERRPTFFETVTAMALLEFARSHVDVAVLEVGLGGRFDATNVTEPVVSVVSTVALEHTRYLGDTLEAIAYEKAGVARAGRPLVTGRNAARAQRTLAERARAIGARLVVAARRVEVEVLASSRRGHLLAVRTARGRYPTIRLPLPGRHQVANAEVAIAALEALPEPLRPSPSAIAQGLARSRWPGRLEYWPGRPRWLLDGAHNPHAALSLAAYLRELEPGGRKVLLFACLGDKDVTGIVRTLFPLFPRIVLTEVRNPRTLPAGELCALAPDPAAALAERSSGKALALAAGLAGRRGLVVVTGSLYLVGEVMAHRSGRRPPDPGER